MDIRLDEHGVAQILEINPLPGLHPVRSDLSILCGFQGIAHRDLIRMIMESALERLEVQNEAPGQYLDQVLGQDLGRGNALFPGTYIVKSVWEHASHGLDADNVLTVSGPEELRAAMHERQRNLGGEWFAEAYVPGREFNLALLADPEVEASPVQVLAPAEIRFLDFPEDQPQVVGFRAKWLEQSFEYRNTVRELEFPERDAPLLAELSALALDCWPAFGLAGYARVDFRVDFPIDKKGRPWIIDVNANPCLSPDAGFQAALQASGLTFDAALARIFRAAAVQKEVA